MAVLTFPEASKGTIAACVAVQALALYAVANHNHRSLLLWVIAFFVGGFLTDLISGLFHFSFDYVWPANTPLMGPIAVEFRGHHRKPGLDPSAIVPNITKGAYGALPFAGVTWLCAQLMSDTSLSFLTVASLMMTSLWMLGFHQIHSYTHMGSHLAPEEFNRAVANISQLPNRKEQKKQFIKLFDSVGIPPFVRLLQRCRLFLRPEIHWQHHISFESDFSSVNGWSDPLMNLLYRPLARRKKSKELDAATADSTQGSTLALTNSYKSASQ
jgi:hypothetical protein